MEKYTGVFELGDSVVRKVFKHTVTEYAYVATGNKYLRNLRVLSGLNGKLETAARNGEEIEIYVAERCILAIKLSDGKVFASDWGGIGLMPTVAGCLVCILLVFTLIGAPVGIFGGMFIANAGRCGRLTGKAKTVANAVLI